jgi:enoyl-CoA hydratase/carnithine racemase
MDFETIEFELRENGIGILTLNRPEHFNAISSQMVLDLHKIFNHLLINLDCRVVILKGNGKHFCAGLDLKESGLLSSKKIPEDLKEKYFFLNTHEILKTQIYFQEYLSQIILKMRKISQPIIALIQGAASGGGFAFAMAADIRYASNDAKFNNAFIKIGLSGSDVGTSYFLPRLIGLSRASEILTTGRFIDSIEAERMGFISKVVDNGELFQKGLELADQLLLKSPLGLRLTKQAINLSMDAPSLDLITQFENRNQDLTSASKDIKEGISSFFEKRDPKYTLR